jgi:type IV pilus assembly protein PilE
MRRQLGFTLLELMIVVTIIGILAAVAIPQYSQYTRRSKVTEAFNNLQNARTQMEQYYQDNRNYGTASAACPITVPANASTYFTYTCNVDATQQAFVFTATSKGGNGLGAVGAYAYTIDQTDKQQTTAFTGVAAASLPLQCWISTVATSC